MTLSIVWLTAFIFTFRQVRRFFRLRKYVECKLGKNLV